MQCMFIVPVAIRMVLNRLDPEEILIPDTHGTILPVCARVCVSHYALIDS
jgi:hypothetical protein